MEQIHKSDFKIAKHNVLFEKHLFCGETED